MDTIMNIIKGYIRELNIIMTIDMIVIMDIIVVVF